MRTHRGKAVGGVMHIVTARGLEPLTPESEARGIWFPRDEKPSVAAALYRTTTHDETGNQIDPHTYHERDDG